MPPTSRLLALLSLAASLGCSETILQPEPEPEDPIPQFGDLTGRVCDPVTFTWLEGAMAYVTLANEEGYLDDTIITYSDVEGYFSFERLPAGVPLTIYVQSGATIIDSWTVTLNTAEALRLPEPPCLDPTIIDVAVVSGNYDEFDQFLNAMNITSYVLVDGVAGGEMSDLLLDLDAMLAYDLIFFNGGHQEQGVFYNTIDATDPIPQQVLDNLRAYVMAGGNVFGSDWAYDVIEQAWPEKIDFYGVDHVPDSAQKGVAGVVDGAYANEQLSDFLNDDDFQLPVVFDLPVWPVVVDVSPTVSVHITANIEYRDGEYPIPIIGSPVLMSFNGDGGKVLFSSFRLSANLDDQMIGVMKYLMFEL